MALVGGSVVVSKHITTHFHPFFGTVLTLNVALLAILPIYFSRYRRHHFHPTHKEWFFLLLQALFGIVFFRAMMFYGLRMTSTIDAGIIVGTTPALVAVFAIALLKERLRANMVIAIALAVLGITIINLIQTNPSLYESTTSTRIIGNTFILFAVFGEALFTIMRKWTQRIPAIDATFHIIWMAIVISVPFAMLERRNIQFQEITFINYLAIFYYGIFGSLLSFFLWLKGMNTVSVSTSGLFHGFVPVTVMVLSFLLLNEGISIHHLVGIALVITSIVYGSAFSGKSNLK